MKTLHHITFFVKGDDVAGDLTIVRNKVLAKDLDELVEKTYKDYKEALRYIYKRLEADIKCEPLPHPSFSVACFKTDEHSFHYDDKVVLQAYFNKRLKEFEKMHPHWK